MSITLLQIDAFTDQAFGGNPAAICLLDTAKDDTWMQNVAAEMNLSETAFLSKRKDGYDLRWFTPTVEVELCGHATLASTHALLELGLLKNDEEVHYHTRSGILTSVCSKDGITLNFPIEPATQEDSPPPDLLESLGINPTFVGRNRMDYLIELESEDQVQNLQPDFARLSAIGLRGGDGYGTIGYRHLRFRFALFCPGIWH